MLENTETPTKEADELQLEPPSAEEDAHSGPGRYDLLTYPADFTLEVLHQKWRKGDIRIPSIQRQFVWTQAQASRLIESFLLGLPVPPVFLYAHRHSEQLLVVDGQQRMRSVFYYFEGFFGEEESQKRTVFRLKLDSGLSKWDGRAFTELGEDDRRRLENCVLRAYIMKQLSPEGDDTSIYHVFERLNAGGTLLTAQEVRNCICDGPFNELLHKLNERESWRTILGKKKLDRRLRDIELILRFLALLTNLGEYDKPMREFLTRFMLTHKSEKDDGKFKCVFESTADSVEKHLGPTPFHIKAGLNAATFDAVFVAFARNLTAEIPGDTVKERYKKLLEDQKFQELTQKHTSDKEAVKGRIDLAARTLFE